MELAAKGRDLRQEMFNLRLQQASSQLEKPARLRTLRRDIARIETQHFRAAERRRLETDLWLKQLPLTATTTARGAIARSASAK